MSRRPVNKEILEELNPKEYSWLWFYRSTYERSMYKILSMENITGGDMFKTSAGSKKLYTNLDFKSYRQVASENSDSWVNATVVKEITDHTTEDGEEVVLHIWWKVKDGHEDDMEAVGSDQVQHSVKLYRGVESLLNKDIMKSFKDMWETL